MEEIKYRNKDFQVIKEADIEEIIFCDDQQQELEDMITVSGEPMVDEHKMFKPSL